MAVPQSWKITIHKANARMQENVPNSFKMLTRLAKADRHEEFLRRKTDNYTRQRPKSVENCGADIELKARSQPTGTCLPARFSDGCDLGSFFAGAGALVSRSPLSARSTNCGLKTIPSVLGNDGKEIRTIEQSAVATIASRVIVLRINPSHPGEHTFNQRAELLFVPLLRALISTS